MKRNLKEFIVNNKRTIVILVIVLLLVVCSVVIFKKISVKPTELHSEFYEFSSDEKEISGTQRYSNDLLTSEHCIGDICVRDVTFHYVNKIQKIEYVILNNGKKKATGYLYMKYGNHKILLSYSSLEPGKTVKNTSQLFGVEFEQHDDYTLSELTEEEKAAIHIGD